MDVKYYSQSKSLISPNINQGCIKSEVIINNLLRTFSCETHRINGKEYCIYKNEEKRIIGNNPITYYANLGNVGLYISYLISLKNKIESYNHFLSFIDSYTIKSFIENEYRKSHGIIYFLRGSLLYFTISSDETYFDRMNDMVVGVNNLVEFANSLVKGVPKAYIDETKLYLIDNPSPDYMPMPSWAKVSIQAGKLIGLALISSYIGDHIDVTELFGDDTDGGFFGDLDNDISNNFDAIEMQESGGDYYINTDNISFRGNLPPDHSSDGFIFQGGEKYNGHDVYKKNGQTFYWDALKKIFVKIK